jgi:beta-mannanase
MARARWTAIGAIVCGVLVSVALSGCAAPPGPLPPERTGAAQTATPPSARSSSALAAERWIGYYLAAVPTETAPLAKLEAQTGQPARLTHYFLGVEVEPFDKVRAENSKRYGVTPLITLEFWDFREATTQQPEFSLQRIAAGEHDAYLRAFARDAKAAGMPILLRPLHEMNGNWYPWGGTVNTNSPDQFPAAWRHVVEVFRSEGASNVRFVWSPQATSVPDDPYNAMSLYWPGDDYVDYVALDGYNWGAERWQSFRQVFDRGYDDVTALSDKPLFIAETASAEEGGDKAAWIEEMFVDLSSDYPRISGVVWFNRDKERDWRIESSRASLVAFRAGAADWTE